jgi:phage major head subunit gpT-like protein
MGIEFQQVSQDAQIALTEFRNDFAMALVQGGVDAWASDLGLSVTSKALRTRWPVPVDAAGYSEFKGEMKYRSLYQKSLELMPKTWQDGVAELASIIEAPDFVGWPNAPEAMAQAALSLPNEIIAALLEAGTSTVSWDSITGAEYFFDTGKPYNVFDVGVGTFSNTFSGGGTTLTLANVKLADERFRKMKGPNGKPLGLRLTHILAPPALHWTAQDILVNAQAVLVVGSEFAAGENLLKGYAKPVGANELTSDTAWYALALNKPGLFPWIVQTDGTPETMILGRDSALYEKELKVGVNSIRRGNGALALPQCIQHYAGA